MKIVFKKEKAVEIAFLRRFFLFFLKDFKKTEYCSENNSDFTFLQNKY
ncbi:hypothetical protein RV03_GL003021 [Enterococcus gallinarum]|nr:hypothetical protein RV03_GL003021 [Enterococcus gallinarum]